MDNPKPHGPVSAHFMRHYYGAAKGSPAIEETPDDFTCRLQELMALHSAMIAMKDLEIESLKSELASLRLRNQLLESLRKEGD